MEAPAMEPRPQSPKIEGENPAPTTTNVTETAETGALTQATPAPAPTPVSATTLTKPVNALVLDANAIIKNDPSVSTLISQAHELYTIPAVVSEIRDEATRSRFQTTLSPFLTLRTPRPESVLFVTNFARRTGDLQVLSKPDLQLLALTYELEIEKNRGDWRLRNEPNQKRLNGKPPGREEDATEEQSALDFESPVAEEQDVTPESTDDTTKVAPEAEQETNAAGEQAVVSGQETVTEVEGPTEQEELTAQLEGVHLSGQPEEDINSTIEVVEESESEEDGEDDDGAGGWITPSNIKKHQARENTLTTPQTTQRVLQAALITADMAMRNVALRINLNLLDSGFSRITFLKTWVLRCHGCWKVCKDTTKQFCPSCGQSTLTRVSCTTDAAGNFKLHLKKNFVFNNRGNVYSIPKPQHGSASGKKANLKGGGKNGWGQELILAEDQKEYTRKAEEDRRLRYKDLMDEDYLPNILSGARNSGNGRIKIGAGRNVNAKKRK